MGAARRYPTPAEQVRLQLAGSTRAGVRDFDAAWRGAMRAVHWPRHGDRQQWRSALEDTRDVWAAAYRDEPCVWAERLSKVALPRAA